MKIQVHTDSVAYITTDIQTADTTFTILVKRKYITKGMWYRFGATQSADIIKNEKLLMFLEEILVTTVSGKSLF